VDNASVFSRAKDLGTHVHGILSAIDVDALMPDERDLVALIKRQLGDARLDVRDYEYADTRDEQVRYGKDAHTTLEQLRKNILQASEYNIFGSVDVAHISARIEQIIKQLH
jgi:hypothetical protein